MRDVDRGPATGQRAEASEQLELRLCVEGRRRLVEQQDPGIAHERPPEGDLLPLPTGQLHAAVEPFAERRVPAIRQPIEEAVGTGLRGRLLYGAAILQQPDLAKTDVLGRRCLIRHVVLEHPTDEAAQSGWLELTKVDTVEEDPTGCRVVEAGDELDQGRLPRPVAADDGDGLAGTDREADIGDRVFVSTRIPERDVLEHDLTHGLADLGDTCPRVGPIGGRLMLDPDRRRQQLEQVVEIEVVLVHRAEPAE